jgi:hypothetical protein
MDAIGYSVARAWSRLTGVLFLFVVAWLLLFVATAGGVGLDVRPIVFPWLVGVSVLAVWLLVARWLRVILPLAVVVGLGSAIFWAMMAFGMTYPFIAAPFIVFSLAAVLTAIESWQKFPSN